MTESSRQLHTQVYRVTLTLAAVGVPVAGVLTWSSPLVGDVMAVRLAIAGAAMAAVVGSFFHEGIRSQLRGITTGLCCFMVAWFTYIGRLHNFTPDDVVGLMPVVIVLVLLVRTWPEFLASLLFTGACVGLGYAGLEAPAFPLGIVAVLFGAGGTAIGVLSVNRHQLDHALEVANRELELRVTERTAALEASVAEAERASHAKSHFLATMSHELRTPLNAILGYTQMVREDIGDELPEIDGDLERTENSARHLLTLIDDLLDLTRVESGRLQLDPGKVTVADVVNDAIRLLTPALQDRRNHVTLELEPNLAVEADRARLRQILVHVLSNAAKFTDAGLVTISANRDGPHGCIRITDTGIGMTDDLLRRAFDRFVAGDDSTTRTYGGLGLGLTIAKDLVTRMHGEIELASEPGKGTTATLRLPLAQ